jgi:hypothetical protein
MSDDNHIKPSPLIRKAIAKNLILEGAKAKDMKSLMSSNDDDSDNIDNDNKEEDNRTGRFPLPTTLAGKRKCWRKKSIYVYKKDNGRDICGHLVKQKKDILECKISGLFGAMLAPCSTDANATLQSPTII